MAEQAITPIIPNFSIQQEAIAGSSAVIFTATDRKLIEERGGEIDKTRSFRELFANKPLTPEVENQETTVHPGQNTNEVEQRRQEHARMLRNAPLHPHEERVEIRGEELPPLIQPKIVPIDPPKKEKHDAAVHTRTIDIAKELKLDPAALLEKFALEQKELFGLISKIRELHLKRLLTDDHKEFSALSERIKKETTAAAKPEARRWIEEQMEKLTREAAQYKMGLLRSLQAMEFTRQREASITWLRSICEPAE